MTPLLPLGALALLAAAPTAVAQPVDASAPAYALLVGSNRAGPGQQPLEHALDDAWRVRDVLVELGGYDPDHIMFLGDPELGHLLFALDALDDKLTDLSLREEGAVFFFYYSGHAKAQALNLGDEELPLDELKHRLESMQAKVTLVVLDACQAGALSQVKGAEPAADFSYNAAAGLNTQGMAVLASSSATELSQESTELGGSYFTHHLVTGLRGAADKDQDGQVTLSEAYTYAYHRTLISTSATAVGKQHVTLETDLRGKGEMILSHPGRASARVSFPEALGAEVLLHRTDSQTVVGELIKAAGSPLGLALVPGRYGALVRQGDELRRCELELSEGADLVFSTQGCELVPIVTQVDTKGDLEVDDRLEHLMVELSIGGGPYDESAYTDTLSAFGFDRPGAWLLPGVVMLTPPPALGGAHPGQPGQRLLVPRDGGP